ncbi:hypothetical protein LXL04_026191 [Taraxacum kok-saghyz]
MGPGIPSRLHASNRTLPISDLPSYHRPSRFQTPSLIAPIGKKAKDLLTRDYLSDQKFSVSTTSVNGVAITSTATKKGGLSSGDVGAVYKYNNTLIDVKFDTQSNVCFLLPHLPSTIRHNPSYSLSH